MRFGRDQRVLRSQHRADRRHSKQLVRRLGNDLGSDHHDEFYSLPTEPSGQWTNDIVEAVAEFPQATP